MSNADATRNPDAILGPEHDPSGGSMDLKTGWGWILAYAVLVIAIGILALVNPIATGFATGVLVGGMLLVYGVMAIAAGLSALSNRGRWIELLLGILALIAGVVILFNPFAGALSLVWAIGAWLLVAGVFEIVGAFRSAEDRGWRLFLGAVDVVLGALLLFSGPAIGLTYLAFAVGFSFLFRGIFLILVALGIRKLTHP